MPVLIVVVNKFTSKMLPKSLYENVNDFSRNYITSDVSY